MSNNNNNTNTKAALNKTINNNKRIEINNTIAKAALNKKIKNWYLKKQANDLKELNKMVKQFFTKNDPLMKNKNSPPK